VDALSEEQKLRIDLELPAEAWDYESYDLDDIASLFRLIFWTGYVRGRADTKAELEAEVRVCESTL
jgi:hypothetical protein